MDSSKVSASLQEAYSEQYSGESEWRDIGGKYKAENVLELAKGRGFKKVLECGAGDGAVLKWIDASGAFESLSALEISESGAQCIRDRSLKSVVDVKLFDGYSIPYEDKSFDMTYCTHVIEHVEHPRLLMRELARISNYVIFEVPLDYHPTVDRDIKFFLDYGHINIYTPSLFKFLLLSEGFEIIKYKVDPDPLEVLAYQQRSDEGMKKWINKVRRALRSPARAVAKALGGPVKFEEFRHTSMTCLVQHNGPVHILQ